MSYPLRKQKEKKYLFWGMFFTVVCLVLGAISALVSVKSWEKGFAIDAELLRAQNYAIVQDEDKVVDETNDSVEFSAFFLRDIDGDGYAEPLLGTCKEVRGQDTLYMEINVKSSGYLKEGTITIDGKNFYLYGTIPKDYEVEQNYFDTNIKEIKLKKINNGTQKIIMGKVRSGDYTYSSSNLSALNNDIDNYSRNNNKVILNGIYVDDEGNEKEISKEI